MHRDDHRTNDKKLRPDEANNPPLDGKRRTSVKPYDELYFHPNMLQLQRDDNHNYDYDEDKKFNREEVNKEIKIGAEIIPKWKKMDEYRSPTQLEQDAMNRVSNAEFEVDKSQLMAAIASYVESNKKLDPLERCSHKAAVVYIDTGDAVPVYTRPYRIPFHMQTETDVTFQRLWKSGVIVEAPPGCRWMNSLLAVPKKDGQGGTTKVRVTIDFRRLNSVMKSDDRFEIPLIEDIIERLGGSRIFSSIDLIDSYHQFTIHPAHRPKTAFMYRNKQYMFVGAPMGLRHISSVFQRVMSTLLGHLDYVAVYIDDIIIHSKTNEEHKVHVAEVIRILTLNKLRINFDKSVFGAKSISVLGRTISEEGVKVNPQKMTSVHDFPIPKTGKQIESFLGLVNYFRKHIPCYAEVAAPLERIRKEAKVSMNAEQLKAFDSMKQLLLNAPLLSFPNFKEPFNVTCDFSTGGISSVLFQGDINDPDNVMIIQFQSRALHEGERGYSATKGELAAIVYALEQFRPYLWGQKSFVLFTDHKALTYMHTQKKSNRMLDAWLDELSEYNFKVEHLPGVRNVLADVLSRMYPPMVWSNVFDELDEKRKQDATTRRLKSMDLQNNDSDHDGEIVDTSTAQWANFEPAYDGHGKESETQKKYSDVEKKGHLKRAHLIGHFGAQAVVDRLKEEGIKWSGMDSDAKNFLRGCIACLRFNRKRKIFRPLDVDDVTMPFDRIAIDLAQFATSKRGYNYVLVVVDKATRFCFLIPLMDKMATTVATALFQLFCQCGFPKVIQMDNGKEFVNHVIDALRKHAGIDRRLTTPYNPQANGLAERFVKTMTDAVRKLLMGDNRDWDNYIPGVQYAMNTKVHSLLGVTPFSLMYARRHNAFENYSKVQGLGTKENEGDTQDQVESHVLERLKTMTEIVFPELRQAREEGREAKQQAYAKQKKVLEEPFPDGCFVMVIDETRSTKLDPIYEGPYTVMRRNKGGAYWLMDLDKKLLPRAFASHQMKMIAPSAVKDIDGEHEYAIDEPVYAVEAIIDRRTSPTSGRAEYLVKWKDYGIEENSWEPSTNFKDLDIVRVFNEEQDKREKNSHDAAKKAKRATVNASKKKA